MSHDAIETPLLPPDAFLAALVESSDDAIMSKDLGGTIRSWNGGAVALFGYSAAEAVGQPVTLIVPSERVEEEQAIFENIRRGRAMKNVETVRRAKDGSLREVSLTNSPIHDAAGNIIGASGIARDIGQQRQILHELKRSEERYRVTLASIGDGVIATDAEGKVTFINPVAEQLTGWNRRDAQGRPLAEVFRIVNEFTRQVVENPVEKVLRANGIVGLANHTVLIARDGAERTIDDSGAPVRDFGGRIVGVVLVFRDASERRSAELTAIRLASIIEHSVDAIVGKDLKGIVTSWNESARRIFGYSPEEMIGQSITKLIPADRQHEEPRILARLQQGETVEPFETMRVRKDGSTLWVRVSISPIKDREGRIVGASKIARDVTQEREAALALALHTQQLEVKVGERTLELEDKVSELEAFSYSLSHDLRAPLRSIESFTEIVLADYGAQLDAVAVSHLNRVVNAARRMDRLIQDVLAFSRVARRVVVAEPVDVGSLIDEIIHERPELQSPQVEIVLERPLLSMLGHPASLTQCLSNLLDNAAKFVAPGVKPRIRVWTEAVSEKEVRLWVEDNGIGITPEARHRLFGLFQRVHSGADYRGMGVGLAIVRKAAERMNGQVGVESELGKGSRFWLQLPRA